MRKFFTMSTWLDILYHTIDTQSSVSSDTRPVIGISCNRKDGLSCIADPYFKSVILAGGAPVLLPVTTDIEALTAVINHLDGLILSGGGDIDPSILGEEPIPELLGETDIFRDEYDFIVLRLAFFRQIPIFGICRGHQVINVAFGGTLYQDIHTQFSKEAWSHSQQEARDKATHVVALTSRLRDVFKCPKTCSEIPVNSFHHQAVKKTAPEFIATATSLDGLIEAMEHPEYAIFSVQWHPEAMAIAGNDTMLELFRYHIRQASVYAKARLLHHHMVTIDSHVDTPMIAPSFDLGRKEGGKVNLLRMREGQLDAVFMVAYVPQGVRDDESLTRAIQYAEGRLLAVTSQIDKYQRYMELARMPDDLWRIKKAGKKAIFLGVENGYAVGKDIGNIKRFRELGVVYMTLCHNAANDICDSVVGEVEWGGVSPFGKQVIAEMNRLGMIIDVSHAANSTFYDVLKYSTKPVIASHSSARALCDHPRNLDDDQLRALASQGGVVQLCLYKPFINEEAEKASVSDLMQHLYHIIEIVGINHVGIGSDFDGDGELIGCRAANELKQITIRLLAEGFDDDSIARIWGGNLIRVMKENIN